MIIKKRVYRVSYKNAYVYDCLDDYSHSGAYFERLLSRAASFFKLMLSSTFMDFAKFTIFANLTDASAAALISSIGIIFICDFAMSVRASSTFVPYFDKKW